MLTAIIVGAGHRALAYAQLAKIKGESLKIVGVADPLPERRKYTREYFSFGEEMCFESAEELAARGITVNAVAPGLVETDMTKNMTDNNNLAANVPLGRMAQPEEVANLVTYLASPMAGYVTGEVIRIDGGLAM